MKRKRKRNKGYITLFNFQPTVLASHARAKLSVKLQSTVNSDSPQCIWMSSRIFTSRQPHRITSGGIAHSQLFCTGSKRAQITNTQVKKKKLSLHVIPLFLHRRQSTTTTIKSRRSIKHINFYISLSYNWQDENATDQYFTQLKNPLLFQTGKSNYSSSKQRPMLEVDLGGNKLN